jgi:hypothetical protein
MRRPTPAILLLLVLVACGRAEPARQASVCPQPGILAGLESTTVFRGGSTSGPESDLLYYAALENIGGGCVYDGSGLTVDLSVDVIVEPGPAFEPGPVSVPWFVAVADAGGAIIDKTELSSLIEVPPGAARGGSREAIQQRFAGLRPETGGGYRIYLGLEIDRDEALRRRSLLR